MAVFARAAHTGAKSGQFYGRDINFVRVALSGIETTYTQPDSTFEKVVRTLQMYGTMSIVGVPASGDAVFAMEGLQTGSGVAATVIKTAIDAAVGGGANSTITIYGTSSGNFGVGISGNVFAV